MLTVIDRNMEYHLPLQLPDKVETHKSNNVICAIDIKTNEIIKNIIEPIHILRNKFIFWKNSNIPICRSDKNDGNI